MESITRQLREQIRQLVSTERRLYSVQRDLDRQLTRIQALNAFALQTCKAQGVEHVLSKAIRLFFELYQLDRGLVLWRDETDPGLFRVVAQQDHTPEESRVLARTSFRLTSEMLRALERNTISDATREPMPSPLAGLLADLELQAGSEGKFGIFEGCIHMVAPLRHADHSLLGILMLRKLTSRSYSFHCDIPSSEDGQFFDNVLVHIETSLQAALANQELKAITATLEHKVNQRTLELARSNRELRLSLDQLRDTQRKLFEANQMSALGHMASGIAHEINNPLAIIQLLANQARNEETSERPRKEAVIEYLSKIHFTADRIANIVRGLRHYSREGFSDPLETVQVAKMVEETLSFCRERFKARSIDLRIDPIPEGLSVRCHGTQVSQVLLNLLNNSHDAVEGGNVRWIRLTVRDRGENIEIAVEDSGQGIPAGARDRIFTPFYTTKEIGKGTGLGLPIARGIVEAHNGKLFFDETAPFTRFVILLPKFRHVA